MSIMMNWDPLYPERHREIIDYHPYVLTSSGLRFRGPDPRPLPEEKYVTCIGSAHTYGCFVERPYPLLLQINLGIPVLNLGYGGVGPSFFNRNAELINIANKGRIVVLQVMSARCESNSRFFSNGSLIMFDRKCRKWMRAEEAWQRILFGDSPLLKYSRRLPSIQIILRLVSLFHRTKRIGYIERLIKETRAEWVRQYTMLIKRLRVPKILFWFSTRTPDYDIKYNSLSLKGIFGEFPQLVNRDMVQKVAELCDAYVECISNEGLPQSLRSRFSGGPARIPSLFPEERIIDPLWAVFSLIRYKKMRVQTYYPSPEMHRKAAALLEKAIKSFL